LELLAASVVAERQTLRLLRERLTICRRDIRKLISAAMEEGASGDWGMIESHFLGLLSQIPRAAAASTITDVVDEMELLRDEVVNILEFQVKAEKTDGNDDQNGRHIQNSNPDSITESEPALEKEQGGETTVRWQKAIAGRGGDVATTIKAFPLGMVLRSCPEIAMYGPGGAISSWRDMMGAAIVVRSMLGVSPSAYQEACEVMGPENAATVIACILERAGHINSAGGYIRDLTAKARRGEFSLGPMLMSLMRAGAGAGAGTHQKAG
jgi:replication initiation protein RepC